MFGWFTNLIRIIQFECGWCPGLKKKENEVTKGKTRNNQGKNVCELKLKKKS